MMLYFDSDYLEGAHSSILEKLVTTNLNKLLVMAMIHIANLLAKKSVKLATVLKHKFIFSLVVHRQMLL